MKETPYPRSQYSKEAKRNERNIEKSPRPTPIPRHGTSDRAGIELLEVRGCGVNAKHLFMNNENNT